jgi:hypothetical protein
MADKVVIEAEVKSNIGEVSKDASNAASEFKIMGVSLNGVKAGFASAAVTAKGMFGSIKAGLISTGIGAFVVLIGSLTQYFRDSEEGASKFKQITSQLGVVVGNVTDIISNLGKAVFKLVTGDFSGFKDSLAEVTEGVKDFGETTRKEMAQANQLEKDRLSLQQFEREAIVDKAKTEKDMMELRLKARDFEKFAAEERLVFMREANKLAAEQLEKDLFVAKEKLRFQVEENSYSKSTQQNLDDEAALQAAVFNLERSNFSERKRLKSEEQAIVKELQATALSEQKEKDDEAAKIQKEKDDAKAKQVKQDIADAKIVADAKIKEDARVAKAEEDLAKLVEDTKQKTIAMGFASAKGLAKEGSAAAKAIGVAETIYNTQAAIMQAMKLPPPFNAIQAGITGVMGAAAVAKILSTNPENGGGGGGGGGASAASGGTPAPQMMSGAFDLTGGVAPEPVQAFVLTDEMTNSQNQLANIRRRATI